MVKFSPANVKIEALYEVEAIRQFLFDNRSVYSFDLLSGHSCPFASECLSKVVIIDGKKKIKDGPNTQFRCFSASQEVAFPNVYNSRNNNFSIVRRIDSVDQMVSQIEFAMPSDLGVCRIHVAGDFFNQVYFDAWLQIAYRHPSRLFYAYTKSIPYWLLRRDSIPSNLILTASLGGRKDSLVFEHGLRYSKVVFSEQEASDLGFAIDHTDEFAANPQMRDTSFALLIHGQQPAGSQASAAIKELKKTGTKFSYAR